MLTALRSAMICALLLSSDQDYATFSPLVDVHLIELAHTVTYCLLALQCMTICCTPQQCMIYLCADSHAVWLAQHCATSALPMQQDDVTACMHYLHSRCPMLTHVNLPLHMMLRHPSFHIGTADQQLCLPLAVQLCMYLLPMPAWTLKQCPYTVHGVSCTVVHALALQVSADAVSLAAEQLLAEERAVEAKVTAKQAKRLRQKQKKQAQQVGDLPSEHVC